VIPYIGAVARDLASEAGLDRAQSRNLETLRKSGHRKRPVVVGPWVSEVGFEVLYWIPTLRNLAARGRIPRERTMVISRGGAHPWYEEFAGEYVDILDHFTPTELREFNERRVADAGGQKHQKMTEFDEEIFKRIGGIDPRAIVVHPSAMYNAYQYFWRWKMRPQKLLRSLDLAPLPDPGTDPELARALPDDYVAVKAYFSSCFPATDENKRFLVGMLERLAARTHVVLLSTGLEIDDHEEFSRAGGDRIVDARSLMTPRDNLAVQTRIIKGARALVTTYGGFSYLGPFLGVPSVCFYSDHNFNSTHFELMRHVVKALEGSHFVALDTRDIGLLDALIGERERETA